MSLSDYRLNYQINPIILVGGIAGMGQLPISSLLSVKSYPGGVTSPPAAQNPLQTISNFVHQVTSLSGAVQGEVTSLLNQYRALSHLTPQQIPSLIEELKNLPGVTTQHVNSIVSQLSSLIGGSGSGSPQGMPPTIAPFFGEFRVISGHTLIDNELATYPLANQQVAANAVITQPLRVSLEMLAPANNTITAANKMSLMTALKSTLDKHTELGGWYNIATPSYIYQGCLLLTLTDATEEDEGNQVQVRWVWSFSQPLLTAAAAQAAQNQAMAKISNQTRNTGNPPGSQPVSTGVSQPAANIVQNILAAASNPIGSNVTPANIIATGRSLLKIVSPLLPGGL